ncbi:histone acetyltransferase KAT6A-like [Notolabrus celidotus]|uniref:histone acetyltransferase KAT6A-like n=1 Tax=Notolabrus celidotus TaxID=1203425 RepID=UPI00148FB96A|nr:histone acetyltransferase KAT6A-like [Notolabrus celidotus]XP_034558304.1 histone acetyltransferase KAT6A-like [Notolabrus celidotus]
MASSAAVNRPPPAHPGPNPESLPSYNHSRVPNPGMQDPGLQGLGPDLGPHVPARPFMCVPVPPPPPFLHYQWPMPFPYNPFTGFPGMGYGMVMPPFPPPYPYMEAPAYVLPQPHIQPVDYRRLVHPSVPVPSAPYQHQSQPRRVRPPHAVPVRETMNSEVQTEPIQRGAAAHGEVSPLLSSDSGHGTTSNSPSSSSSSSHRPGQAEAETFPRGFQVNKSCSGTTVTRGFNVPHPAGSKTVQSCTRKPPETQRPGLQENAPLCRNVHRSMWSVDSPDGMVPVCSSSQQEDEVTKDRRVSVPDILMSWMDGSTQEVMRRKSEKVLPQKDQQLHSHEAEVQRDKSAHQSPAGNSPVVADRADDDDDDDEDGDGGAKGALSPKDTEALIKILRRPVSLQELLSESNRESEPSVLVSQTSRDDLLQSFDRPQRLPDNESNPQADTSDITAYQMLVDSFHMKRKMNESVWSVESLAPFIPHKDWWQQSSVLEPKVIFETAEQDENDGLLILNDNSVVKTCKERRRSLRFSSSDSVLMSDNFLVFSTPAVQQSRSQRPEMESESDASEMGESQRHQSMTLTEHVPLTSPPRLQGRIILSPPTREEPDERRSSEPEANQSPNQESFTVPKEKGKSSSEQEEKSSSEQKEKSSSEQEEKSSSEQEEKSSSEQKEKSSSEQEEKSSSEQEERSSLEQEKSPSEQEEKSSPEQEEKSSSEQEEKSSSEQEEKTLLLNSAEEKMSPPCQLVLKDGADRKSDDGAEEDSEVSRLKNGQLSVPAANQTTADVSPSRGHLVDTGVQCHMWTCEQSCCAPNKMHHFKHSDVRDSNYFRTEGFGMNRHMPKNQKRNGSWKHRGQEKQNDQTDGYSGYCGKPGRSRGGNGRNHRY